MLTYNLRKDTDNDKHGQNKEDTLPVKDICPNRLWKSEFMGIYKKDQFKGQK